MTGLETVCFFAGIMLGMLLMLVALRGRMAELRADREHWHRLYQSAEDSADDMLAFARHCHAEMCKAQDSRRGVWQ